MTLEHNLSTLEKTAKPFSDLVNETAEKYPHSWNQVKAQIMNEKWVKLKDVQKLKKELEQRREELSTFWNAGEQRALGQFIDEVLGVNGAEEEVRRCSCGKVLTEQEIRNSQGWHCKKCWEKAMEDFRRCEEEDATE